MPVFNYPKKEVNVKVVYYGPGLSGKTTNLQQIHDGIKPDFRGKLVSLATQTDRTLFFDFMPLELGSLGGYKIRLHLYTVPGQVHYNATRKLVLKGVDGVVFVADSQKAMTDANIESILNLEKNLHSYGKSLVELPHVIQANKRDLDEVISMAEIDSLLNHHGAVVTEAVASEGKGVLETMTEIVRLVMKGLRGQFAAGMSGAVETAPELEEEPESKELDNDPPAPSPAENGIKASERKPVPESSFAEAPAAQEAILDESEGRPEAESEIGSESSFFETSNAASGTIAENIGDKHGAPNKILVSVDGIGTLELSLNISARLLEDAEIRAIGVDVAGAPVESEPESTYAEVSISAGSAGDKTDGEAVSEFEPLLESAPEQLADPEVKEKPLSLDNELPPLGYQTDEPLGAPLDGQEQDEIQIQDFSQEEKILLDEDLEEPGSAEHSPGPSTEYDPTVQPLDFDFPDTEPEEEDGKKGLFGRFKKK